MFVNGESSCIRITRNVGGELLLGIRGSTAVQEVCVCVCVCVVMVYCCRGRPVRFGDILQYDSPLSDVSHLIPKSQFGFVQYSKELFLNPDVYTDQDLKRRTISILEKY